MSAEDASISPPATFRDESCSPSSAEKKTAVPPLTLEAFLKSSGITEVNATSFCQDAKDWLGLIINPDDIRNSVCNPDEIDPKFELESPQMPLEPCLAMTRILIAAQIETLLNSSVMKKMDAAIQAINEADAPDQYFNLVKNLICLYQEEKSRCFYSFRRLVQISDDENYYEVIMRDLSPKNEYPMSLYTTTRSNMEHDLNSACDLNNIKLIADLFSMSGSYQEKVEKTADIIKLWNNGDNIRSLPIILTSFQDEMVPGWCIRETNLQEIIRNISGSVARRFQLAVIEDDRQDQAQNNNGTISIEFDNLPERVQVPQGLVYRIIYNLIKNTVKTYKTNQEESRPPLAIEIKAKIINQNLIITLKDNLGGFDLNVPFKSMEKIVADNPEYLDIIRDEISPKTAEALTDWLNENRPFAIYLLTLKDVFKFFLLRRVSGKEVMEQEPQQFTSGIGLHSLKEMLGQYNGGIFLTNHPRGGAFTLIYISLGDSPMSQEELMQYT